MGYSVPSLTLARDYVIANGVALLLTYIVNIFRVLDELCLSDNHFGLLWDEL